MLLVEKGVDEPSEHPSEERLSPDKCDRVVKLNVLNFIMDLVRLFESEMIKE